MQKDKKKVLIIEDDKSLINVLTTKLYAEGFIVLQADNVQLGLAEIKENNPDIIILDIMLPGGLHGFDLLEKLKDTDYLKKIIVLTNIDSEEKVAKDMGVKYYLVKSNTSIEDIIKKVKSI